jgi:MoaA/NifB/PqqE/SkfB family radical SAM enzyme
VAQWIALHLTERCARRCVHCLRDVGPRPRDLPLGVIEKVLDEARLLHGVDHVGLTGGDPLLHPRFEQVLDAIAGRQMTWHVVQSGQRFDRLVALLEAAPARRAALTVIDFSLDGAEEATHDALRGAGSWREVMAAMLAAKARAIPFSVQATLNAINAAELEPIGLAAADLGAERVGFSMTGATGRGDDGRLYLAPAALDDLRDRVERLAARLRLPVTGAEGFRRAERLHACAPLRGDILHVDPRGHLTLCCSHSGVAGAGADAVADLADVSLAEAHRRLLTLIHDVQQVRLAALAAGPTSGWDDFQCNACLKHLGRPHWVDGGSAGPRAHRPPAGDG